MIKVRIHELTRFTETDASFWIDHLFEMPYCPTVGSEILINGHGFAVRSTTYSVQDGITVVHTDQYNPDGEQNFEEYKRDLLDANITVSLITPK